MKVAGDLYLMTHFLVVGDVSIVPSGDCQIHINDP